MPTNITNKNALTLTELVVSSVLVGIVLISVASITMTVQNTQDNTAKMTNLIMKTTQVTTRMVKDADLATGDGSDRGILRNSSGTTNCICFRHDISNTPSDYSDDQWVCYFHGSNFQLWRIPVTVSAANYTDIKNNGWCGSTLATCQGKSTAETHIIDLKTDDNSYSFYTINNDVDGRLQYVEFTLTTRSTPTAAKDFAKNPEYSLTTRVSPISHSR